MSALNIPSTIDRRREYRRVHIGELRQKFQDWIQRGLALRHHLDELWFQRERFEANNPKLLKATVHSWTIACVAFAGVVAAWIIDRTLLKPTLEYILMRMSENEALIAVGVYVLPAVLIAIDLLIGIMLWKVIEERAHREIGRLRLLIWLLMAGVWISMMPALTIEAHRAAVHAGEGESSSLGLQLWGMVVLALVAHGGIVLSGQIIHDSFDLAIGSRQHRALSEEIRRVREEYLKTASAAVVAHGEYEHEVLMFNRDYPHDLVSVVVLDRLSSDLLSDWSNVTGSIAGGTKSGSIN